MNNIEEFVDVCDILQYEFKKVSTTTSSATHHVSFLAASVEIELTPDHVDRTDCGHPHRQGGAHRRVHRRRVPVAVRGQSPCARTRILRRWTSRAPAKAFRIIASKRGTKDHIYRAMFLEDDDGPGTKHILPQGPSSPTRRRRAGAARPPRDRCRRRPGGPPTRSRSRPDRRAEEARPRGDDVAAPPPSTNTTPPASTRPPRRSARPAGQRHS